ncbi:MAG: oxygen-dependent coproporphyrinogen oxidase [Ignavibacteriales bacterium]|nr:oxygen-dependent coproporphyrinogen oxidase [Ignavibacteriales bacterium]
MDLQTLLCRKLEELDGKARFAEDWWEHHSGGGGRTCVIQEGNVFEKGAVNTSAISTKLTPLLAERMKVSPQEIFATGVSLILHPSSPMIPTVHANFRYLELQDGSFWFGGGADLTPYYLFEEDAHHFHAVWKTVCEQYNSGSYERFKEACDEYFFLKHRLEARGIGGIFFDYLKGDFEKVFSFVRSCAESFLKAYLPIVERRFHEPWGEREKNWQLFRRGRYVEFNLIYDRGTLFGLETQGRTESILLSLPPLVRWGYNIKPERGSKEEQLIKVLRSPRNWMEL